MARSYITVVIAEPIVTIVLPQCTIATSQIVATYRCFMSQQTSLRLVMPLTWFRPVGLGVSRWSTFCWYHLNPPIQRWYGNLGSERWRYCFNKLSIQFVVWRVHHCIKSVVVLTSFPWRFFAGWFVNSLGQLFGVNKMDTFLKIITLLDTIRLVTHPMLYQCR